MQDFTNLMLFIFAIFIFINLACSLFIISTIIWAFIWEISEPIRKKIIDFIGNIDPKDKV